MPNKKYQDYTDQEANEFNVDLFGTLRMLDTTDKSQIYGLKAITNKIEMGNEPYFDAFSLTERDLDLADQIFDEVFAPAVAFHRKHGVTSALDNFYWEDKGPVKKRVGQILKEQKMGYPDERTLEKYTKAYILYSMCSPKEKVFYNPGRFKTVGIYELTARESYLFVAKQGGGSQAKLPLDITGLAGINREKARWGDTSIKPVLKKPEEIKQMDPRTIFEEYEQEYRFDPDAYGDGSLEDILRDDFHEFDLAFNDEYDYFDDFEKKQALEQQLEAKKKNPFMMGDKELLNAKKIVDVDENLDELYDNPDDKRKPAKEENPNRINIINDENNIINDNKDDNYIKGGFAPQKKQPDPNKSFDDLDFDDFDDIDLIDDEPEDRKEQNIQPEQPQNNEEGPVDPDIEFLERTLKTVNFTLAFGNTKQFGDEIKQLYNKAHSDDPRPEDKLAWGANALLLHFELQNALKAGQADNPELFEYDKDIIAVREAYKLNTNYAAEALTQHQTDIFQPLIEKMISKIDAMQPSDDDGKERKFSIIEDQMAKILYLGKLQNEYKNVHGTEAEIKAWKESILNEVLSDSFEQNCQNFKQSEVYRSVMSNIELISVNARLGSSIKKGILDLAEEKYNEVYHYFGHGAKNENEIRDVEKRCAELNELKTMGVAAGLSNDPDFAGITFDQSMFFDTQFIRKKANLYGQQVDLVNDLIEEKKAEVELNKNINKAYGDNRDDIIEDYLIAEKKLKENEEKLRIIDRFEYYDRKVRETKAKIEELGGKLENEHKITMLNKALHEFTHLLRNAEEDKKLLNITPAIENDLKEDRRNFRPLYRNVEQRLGNLKNDTIRTEKEKFEAEKQSREDEKLMLPTRLREEDREYREALQKNDINTVKIIRAVRLGRDKGEKLRNPHLYEPHVLGEKNNMAGSFISRNYQDAFDRMNITYRNYKKRFGADQELDQRIIQSFNDNMAIQAEYDRHEKDVIVRPDRPQFRINLFDTVIDSHISLDDVEPLLNIKTISLENQQAAFNPDYGYEPVEDVEYAFELLKTYSSKWYGTDEYKRIRTNLKQLKERMNQEGENINVEETASTLRKIKIELDQYIDRKLDEKQLASHDEQRNSRNRRTAAEVSRNHIIRALEKFEEQHGLAGRDSTVDEVKQDIAVVRELTNLNIPEMNTVTEQLGAGNVQGAIATLTDYLKANVNKYKNPETGYGFRIGHLFEFENEQGKIRIPADKRERVYKTLLKCTEKLVNYEQRRLKKESPENLPEFRAKLNHMNGEGEFKGKSYHDAFGITVTETEDDLTIKRSNSVLDYADQFETKYKTLLNKKKAESIDKRLYDPQHYSSRAILDVDENEFLIESALSNLYLKNYASEHPNEEFNFDNVELLRRKFITVVKESGVYETLREKTSKYMDLSHVEDEVDIRNHAASYVDNAATPGHFNRALIGTTFIECLTNNVMKAQRYLNDPNYKYEDMKQKIETIDKNIKLAKAFGLGNAIESVNNRIESNGMRGANFAATIKNLKDQAKARSNIRVSEATRGVRL